MKTFVQTLVLVSALAGLSACASGQAGTYEGRTATGSVAEQLAACQERVRRLEDMNKACYRK